MNIGKVAGVVATVGIVCVIGYMAFSDGGASHSADKNQSDTQTGANNMKQAPALSEDEKKIQALKESTETKAYAVSSLYTLKCKACHGSSGRGIIGPNLVGKSEQEILKKLNDYKQDKVKNSLMKGLLINSTDEELNSLASEISKFGK